MMIGSGAAERLMVLGKQISVAKELCESDPTNEFLAQHLKRLQHRFIGLGTEDDQDAV